MVIFLNLDGSCQKITPEHIYQGSNNVTDITVVAPFPASTAMEIGFILPNGLYWTNDDGVRYMPMELAEQSVNPNVSVWHFALPGSVTAAMGDLHIAFNAATTTGNTTSYMCKVQIEESVLPNDAPPPDMSVYDYLKMYLARLDGRTENVPNLVALIQKVKDSNNAFTYTDNSGVVSAPIILGDPYAAPIPVNTASTIEIPDTAWQPTYAEDNTTVTGYTYLLTSAMHGQMRDGATAKDLWVSFDEAVTGGFKGVTGDYTVNETGDITITVNTSIAMTVRVWNGKGLVDKVARDDIAAETERAKTAEQSIRADLTVTDESLQAQINELANTGVDNVARDAVAAETERAEAAEAALQGQIDTIDSYIPSSTTEDNKLADKNFVNSSINNIAAFYIEYNSQGDAFPTRADLLNATTFYSGGKPRVPTQNDYATVLADESRPQDVDGSYPTTRYSYQTETPGGTYPNGQWGFQYVVNNTSLTQAQVNAINSGITKEIVEQIGPGNVLSVNGQTGAVTITPANIGAVSKSGDTIDGDLIVNGGMAYRNGNNSTFLELGKFGGSGIEFHSQSAESGAYLDYDAFIQANNSTSTTTPGTAQLIYHARQHLFQGPIIAEGDNVFIYHGNEFNFIPQGYDSYVWLNYRGGKVLDYRFCNGDEKGGFAPIIAHSFYEDGKRVYSPNNPPYSYTGGTTSGKILFKDYHDVVTPAVAYYISNAPMAADSSRTVYASDMGLSYIRAAVAVSRKTTSAGYPGVLVLSLAAPYTSVTVICDRDANEGFYLMAIGDKAQ
jgi:hypothetical protein